MKDKSLDQRVAELEAALERLQKIVFDTGAAASAIIPIICAAIPEAKPRIAVELIRAIEGAGERPAIEVVLRGSLGHLD